MNYLELVRELARETGTIGNADPDNETIVTLASPDNPYLIDLKRWINRAWTSIQLHSPWRFMIESATINTVADQQEYDLRGSLVTDYRRILPYAPLHDGRGWIRVGDDQVCWYVHWHDWTGFEETLSLSAGVPRWFTMTPEQKLKVTPAPNGIYEVTFNYLIQPVELSDDSDEPDMPSEYHEIIIWRAMMKYAAYDETDFHYKRASLEYRELLMRLRNEQLETTKVIS